MYFTAYMTVEDSQVFHCAPNGQVNGQVLIISNENMFCIRSNLLYGL